MKRLIRFLFALALTTFLCSPTLAERAPEVVGRLVEIPNPGAENQEKVSGWTTPGGISHFSRDTSVSRSGQASFHVINERHPSQSEDSKNFSAVYDVSVEAFPGVTYTASGYVKIAEGEAGYFVLGSASGNNVPGAVTRKFIVGPSDWTKLTLQFGSTAADTSVRLLFGVRGKGEAWFDDIEIRDNAQEVIGSAFPPLRAELARVRAEAESLGEDFPAEDLVAISKALAKAERFEKETSEIGADLVIASERWRAIFDARKEFDEAIVRYSRRISMQKVLAAARRLTGKDKPVMIVGFAPSTVHVFIEDRPFSMDVVDRGKILAVRGEREAIQLVILSVEKDLTDVTVSVTDLRSDKGVIPASAVSINPVGFVKIESPLMAFYPQEPVYIGWWPDPVLPNFPFDVKKGQTQPVWISVRVPRDLKAGKYAGRIRLKAANAPELKVGLEVEVADVDLPEKWHFGNQLWWQDNYGPQMYGDRWTPQLRDKFVDLHLERRLNVAAIRQPHAYMGQVPTWPDVDDLITYGNRGEGLIWIYDFWYGKKMTDSKGNPLTELPAEITSRIARLKEAGLYDRVFIHGWDEVGADMHPHIRIAAELLARDYPGVPLLITGVDKSCGTETILGGLPNIIFCPFMTSWDPEAVRKAKENGNTIWWYDVYWTIEQHLIRSRLIPWQSYKVGAEGFLIWCMNRWKGNDKLVSGKEIRTVWKPYLDGAYRSNTAMYIYPGEDGPISSLRLENFCDGMEDYDLLITARDLLTELESRGDVDAAVTSKLHQALSLEDEFVKDALNYSTDSQLLMGRRRTLIEALASARRYLP